MAHPDVQTEDGCYMLQLPEPAKLCRMEDLESSGRIAVRFGAHAPVTGSGKDWSFKYV
jgi:hypothetical protein